MTGGRKKGEMEEEWRAGDKQLHVHYVFITHRTTYRVTKSCTSTLSWLHNGI